ncbi:hypothetical protein LJC46_01190 [Desulfovibrio sp. OttesenSCG-928-G15]|nr:hypothetical protein [Desulfovibrio sp. OttesenSCG-928-G15]
MNKYTKIAAALVLTVAATGAGAGIANAQWGHGGPCGFMNNEPPSPEMQQMISDAYQKIAPKLLELRAKRDELTAKIYEGADQATIDGLKRKVDELQSVLNSEHVKLQQQFAKAGMPLHMGGRCMMGFDHRGMGPGPKGMMGGHRGMHGFGHGPAMPPAPDRGQQ